MVQHTETGDEVEALGCERGRAQVGPDDGGVGPVVEIASRSFHRHRTVECDLGRQVLGQDAGEASLAAPGVETDLAVQRGEVEVPEVDLGELVVLVSHAVEGVPLVAETGEGALGGASGRRLLREIEVAPVAGVAVAFNARHPLGPDVRHA